MILLAIDTVADLCAACVWDADAQRELGRCVRDIGKGHAEVLMAVIDEALAAAGRTYADLGAVAVAVGPGSFTGIRVGVAAARGLALALSVPSAGVSTLDALAEDARAAFPGRAVLVALDARREEFYVAAQGPDTAAPAEPRRVRLPEAVALTRQGRPVLAGSGAATVAQAAGGGFDLAAQAATADVATYARLAAQRGFSGERPRPLYLRDADARPQQGFALPRKDA